MIRSLCAGGSISLQFLAISSHREQSLLGVRIEPTKWNQSKESHSICKHQRIQTKRAQENASQGFCLQRSGLSQIQPSPVQELERLCLMHCLGSSYPTHSITEHTLHGLCTDHQLELKQQSTQQALPTQTNLKINAEKGEVCSESP